MRPVTLVRNRHGVYVLPKVVGSILAYLAFMAALGVCIGVAFAADSKTGVPNYAEESVRAVHEQQRQQMREALQPCRIVTVQIAGRPPFTVTVCP